MVDFKCDYGWTQIDGTFINHMKCGSIVADNEGKKRLFLIIPGNPGSMYFYDKFAFQLHQESGIPVWGISHTGHVSTSRLKDLDVDDKDLVKHPHLNNCGLQEQIITKIMFLKYHILPKVDEVYLIGHSIGCYISLHVLNEMKSPKIKKLILLFPTIENLHTTDNGKIATPLCKFRWLAWYLGFAASFLPNFLKNRLVEYFVKTNDERIKDTVLKDILNAEVCDSSSIMGYHEMKNVRDRNDDIINKYSSSILMYYGATDGWCPTSYYYSTRARHCSIQMELCSRGIEHAFVQNNSEEMADLVAMWSKNDFVMKQE